MRRLYCNTLLPFVLAVLLIALLPTGGAAYTLLPSIVAVVMQLAVFVGKTFPSEFSTGFACELPVRNATGIVTGMGLRVIPEILVDNVRFLARLLAPI